MTARTCITAFASILIGLSLHAQSAHAEIIDSQFENQLFTDLENPTPEESGSTQKSKEFTAVEIPTGQSAQDMAPNCDPRRLEDTALAQKTVGDYYSVLKDYFARCQSELKRDSKSGLEYSADQAKVGYNFNDSPLIIELKIPLNNGVIVPGLMAMKPDSRPRPLVVFKCGVFCTAGQAPSNRAYLMHLFDQSPFNVILLSSQTGMDYIAANHVTTMGGWQEGQESLEVGKWLRNNWAYRNRISSMHFMGISLGGNAAIFGAAYNDKYQAQYGKKLFNSVAAICPVISLGATLDYLYNFPAIGAVFSYKTRQHVLGSKTYLTDVPDMISPSKIPLAPGMPGYLGDLESASLTRRGTPMDRKNYYYNNDFWNLKTVPQTPTLVWASKDDPIVNYGINAGRAEKYFKGSKYSTVLGLNSGGHCGFAGAYGSQAAATVLRTFVLKNSPEFLSSEYTKQTIKLEVPLAKLSTREVHVNQAWEFAAGSDKVAVSFKIFDGTDSKCASKGPWKSNEDCKVTRRFIYPLSTFKALGARIPKTATEAYTLTREFNTKVEFRSSKGPLTGSNGNEVFASWRAGY